MAWCSALTLKTIDQLSYLRPDGNRERRAMVTCCSTISETASVYSTDKKLYNVIKYTSLQSVLLIFVQKKHSLHICPDFLSFFPFFYL